jgi:hypothetical protein
VLRFNNVKEMTGRNYKFIIPSPMIKNHAMKMYSGSAVSHIGNIRNVHDELFQAL